MKTMKLKIESMGCQACVRRVTTAIEKVDGARPVSVTVGAAVVEYDESKTGAEVVAAAVTQAGYPAAREDRT